MAALGRDSVRIGLGIRHQDRCVYLFQFCDELAQQRLRVLDLAGYLASLAREAAEDVFIFHAEKISAPARKCFGPLPHNTASKPILRSKIHGCPKPGPRGAVKAREAPA